MLLSAEDIGTSLNRAFTDGQQTAVEDILQGLEDDLQTFLKRPLVPTVVTDEVATYREGTIRLKKTPVQSVESFTIDGTAVATTSYDVKPWGLTSTWASFGPGTVLQDAVLLVSYTGGLPGDDPESDFGRAVRSKLRTAAKRIAVQEVIEKAVGVDRISVEGTSISFIGAGGGWLDSELAALARFKRRIART